MPDIHFHDVYAKFEDESFEGLGNSISGKKATIRTMASQLKSTRLFNENYFVFLAALDDVVVRGVKYVALPGDFSDDGQPINIRGLRKILDRYSRDHGIEFFAAPGNHDPTRPFGRPGGKPDYLGSQGQTQPIFSPKTQECLQANTNASSETFKNTYSLPIICSEDVKELGYETIMAELANHGFYPKKNYIYWETPYSDYDAGVYTLPVALAQASFKNRHYEICREGTGGDYKNESYSLCRYVPDTSYLVEPMPGLWLLAIDANVYIPEKKSENNVFEFLGSSYAGYNRMLSHKAQVVEWIKKVTQRADKLNKKLIAFSHFPMVEFYDNQSGSIAELFDAEAIQLKRKPKEDVTRALADAGIRIHVGGHMHINDTGVRQYQDGRFLINIQAPSMAAYVPAYKLMTFKENDKIEVETVIMENVPGFNELFEHYQQEYDFLQSIRAEDIWDKSILDTENYRAFTDGHLRALVRNRLLNQDWPEDLREMLLLLNGKDMLILSQIDTKLTVSGGECLKGRMAKLRQGGIWQTATIKADEMAEQAGFLLHDFSSWNGLDFAVDFYRLFNADQLALGDIPLARLKQYKVLSKALESKSVIVPKVKRVDAPAKPGDTFFRYFPGLIEILTGFQKGEPSKGLILDLKTGETLGQDKDNSIWSPVKKL